LEGRLIVQAREDGKSIYILKKDFEGKGGADHYV
jgi:hypothetical protein